MSIDTAEKRRSAFQTFHPRGFPTVTPNLNKDQEWRQEVFWSYSGILVSDSSGIPVTISPQPVMEPYPLVPLIDGNGFLALEWHRWFQTVIDSEFSMLSEQAGPPGTVPARTGLTNIDTLNKSIYISAGTSSSADWILVN